MENLEEEYKGNIFTISQIKKLAEKYNMRFLQSRYYCGEIDTAVIAKLKAFNKETGVEITDGNLQQNFYILAPESCFHLERVEVMRRPPDPALFYKVDDKHYRMIHQWGRDFNLLNRIAGLNWKSRKSKFWLQQVLFLLAFAAVFTVAATTTTLTKHPAIMWPVLAASLCFITARNLLNAWNDDIWHNSKFHNGKWNNSYDVSMV